MIHSSQKAYEHCREITRYHSRTFYVASGLMPQDKNVPRVHCTPFVVLRTILLITQARN